MRIENYIPGDEEKILGLFEKVFGKPMSAEYWKWRFLNNPTGRMMIKLMWDDDVLAGHYAASPVVMKYHDEQILTALSMTTMTHPDYGGRGIFSELAEAMYADGFSNDGLVAVWGFPNNNSHYGFIKNLKWKNLEQIPTLSAVPEKIKTDSPPLFRTAAGFSAEHEAAAEEILQSYPCRTFRSREWLTWRYALNPSNEYEIFETEKNGTKYFAVCKFFPSFTEPGRYEIDITELVLPPDYSTLSGLLHSVKNHYKYRDVCKINTWLPLNDHKHILLEKAGFVNGPPFTYSGLRLMNDTYSDLLDCRNWYYSMGDSDIY